MDKKKPSTNKLTLLIGLPGFIVALIWAITKDNYPTFRFSHIMDATVTAFLFFMLGWTGLLWVVRREAPQVLMVKGKPAVLIGWVMVLGSWFFSFYALYLLVLNLLGK